MEEQLKAFLQFFGIELLFDLNVILLNSESVYALLREIEAFAFLASKLHI